MNIDFQPLGDTGIRVQFKAQVSPELNRMIQNFCRLLKKENIAGVVEWVPAFDTVSIYYSPNELTYHDLCDTLSSLSLDEIETNEAETKLVFIPTLYGGEAGFDLPKVARLHQLPEKKVIEIHSKTDYLIYMMGFLPGYPYLGGLSESIATPRLETPRTKVPAGSVGIAGGQTGIYPLESPGGWNIIGRTPVALFDRTREEPFLYQTGDSIRFVPISENEYRAIEQQVKSKTHKVKKEAYNDGQKNN